MKDKREDQERTPNSYSVRKTGGLRRGDGFDKGIRSDVLSELWGPMKAYSGRRKYRGGWDEDLIGTMEVYKLYEVMSNLSNEKKRVGIPVVLDRKALSYYASNIRSSTGSYEDATEMQKDRITSEKQRTRPLHGWRGIKLTFWFRRYPERSQSAVFREMCDKLTSN